MNKIDFKQPKYMLAIVTMPFVILIAWLVMTQFKSKPTAEANPQNLEMMDGLNTNLPDPDLSKRDVKDKFGAYKDQYKKASDYSAIAGIKEDKDEDLSLGGSIYSDDEIDEITTIHNKNAEEARKVKQMQKQFFSTSSKNESGNYSDRGTPKGEESLQMQQIQRQMALIDSLKKMSNPSPVEEQKKQKRIEVEEEPIVEAIRAENINQQYFNSISKNEKETFITAILDQAETVKDGSRIRIRLLDDILLGDNRLKKGTYLYGLVTGFKMQRVVINITSILYENKIINTNLTLYDNDGIKGIYVPQSDFREIMQAAGQQLGQQQMQFDDGTNNLTEFAYGALQDIYRSTAQALTKKIKQNKAALKYNTVVYLINEKENKKRR